MNNSSQVIRNVTTESMQIVNNAVIPTLTIAIEVIVVIVITIFLIALEPVGTFITVSFLLVFSLLFHFFLKNRIALLGNTRALADGMMVQKTQEALGGIKDVKVLSQRGLFFRTVLLTQPVICRCLCKTICVGGNTRMYLETIGFVGLTVFLLTLTISGQGSLNAIPTLGVFILASLRLLPSANRILNALNKIKFSSSVVTAVGDHLSALEPSKNHTKRNKIVSPSISFEHNIQVQNLSYFYPESSSPALVDIDFHIEKGETIGIIGKSGAG